MQKDLSDYSLQHLLLCIQSELCFIINSLGFRVQALQHFSVKIYERLDDAILSFSVCML